MTNLLMIVAFALALVAVSHVSMSIAIEINARRKKYYSLKGRKTLGKLIKVSNSTVKEEMIKRAAIIWGLDNRNSENIIDLIDATNDLKAKVGAETVATVEEKIVEALWGIKKERPDYSFTETVQASIQLSYAITQTIALVIQSLFTVRFSQNKLNLGGNEDGESNFF